MRLFLFAFAALFGGSSVGFASGAGSFEPEHALSKSAEAAAMMMDRFMAEISCYRLS